MEEVVAYRDELIQCAAVCLAAVQNLDRGSTDIKASIPSTSKDNGNLGAAINLLAEVMEERYRQEQKWGPQNRTPEKWMVILGEEFGEVCKDVLEENFVATKKV